MVNHAVMDGSTKSNSHLCRHTHLLEEKRQW